MFRDIIVIILMIPFVIGMFMNCLSAMLSDYGSVEQRRFFAFAFKHMIMLMFVLVWYYMGIKACLSVVGVLYLYRDAEY